MSTTTNSPVTVPVIAQEVRFTPEAIRIWIRAGKIAAAWDEKAKEWLVDPEETRNYAESRRKRAPKQLIISP